MNTKNNQRAKNTQNTIEQIFLTLLTQKELPKITVREISKQAGINPSTFYAHYQDVYDHVLRVTESTDALQDLVATIVETNLSLRDYRTNQVMKKVTSCSMVAGIDSVCTSRTVVAIEQAGNTNPNVAGPLIGGIVGAVAGRELARSNTDSEGRRNTATAAGAVGGAVAGNAIQNRVEGAGYNVHVRMEDGRTTVVNQNSLNGIRQGSYVRIQNGQAPK